MAKRKRKAVIVSAAERQVIANGKLVEEMMNTRGWKLLVAPIFDEMIHSVIGTKKNNRWLTGHFVKSRKDEKKDFYIGYTCGLQELWNSIQHYTFSAEVVKSRITEANELEKSGIVIPMVNDVEDVQEEA